MTKKEQIKLELEKINDQIWNKLCEIRKLDEKQGELATTLNDDRFDPIFHEVGYLHCEESPFGLCAYHRFEDSCHDSCIFSDECLPEEQK